jgi:hypothetical protein
MLNGRSSTASQESLDPRGLRVLQELAVQPVSPVLRVPRVIKVSRVIQAYRVPRAI